MRVDVEMIVSITVDVCTVCITTVIIGEEGYRNIEDLSDIWFVRGAPLQTSLTRQSEFGIRQITKIENMS